MRAKYDIIGNNYAELRKPDQRIARIIESALGVKALRLRVPIGVVRAAAAGTELFGRMARKAVILTRDKVYELEQNCLVCPEDEFRKDTGWAPTTELEEGARITARWYRENGWL